jgi:RNA polymerase sigma-70 factor, ECF subfamily
MVRPKIAMEVDSMLLRKARADACAIWPGIAVSEEAFPSYVAERLVAARDLELYGRELFLAFACFFGDPVAIRALDGEYLSRTEVAVAKVDGARPFLDEVKQALRIRLLIGPPPRIAQYAATGPLAAWLRVAALRLAFDLRRTVAVHDDAFLEAMAEPFTADLPGNAREREAVQRALRAAFDDLSVRQRNVLRLHYVDSLNIDEIGGIYRVHRATAARWLATIRTQLFDTVAEEVKRELDFSESDFQSVLNRIQSQLDISLFSILGTSRRDGAQAGDEDDRCA